MSDKAIPVRVAVRIRPLVPKEVTEGSQHFITKVLNQPQVTVKGSTEAFTYDYVFGPEESQLQVYETAVMKIVGKIFKGYNVTILAYGQTGSGKTFSMGTADMMSTTNAVLSDNSGIIQRAVKDLFHKMGEDASLAFDINVSFLELYMEKVYDLLSKSRNEEVDIREDPKNGIKINGLTETPVSTWEETLKCLENGSLNRRTGATAMNHQSSRSHAIFTLTINQINKDSSSIVKTSKFHLVDLAGSERASKTHAVGERFAEGVNINKGLLSLGNVISALCESNPRHIPYRDSKLTRLLQDSLGGNSHTLMIACVSPADSNYEETLSTLRYADRARKIKNKPIVNQDPTMVEVMALRAQVQQLLAANSNGSTSFAEVEQLRQQLKFAEEEKVHLTRALQLALEENTNMCEKALLADAANMQMKQRLEELQMQAVNLDRTLGAMNQTFNDTGDLSIPKAIEQMLNLKSKIDEIQDVQRKGEIEQVNHDMQSCIASDKENKDSDSESTGSPRRLSKLGADMALRQAALSNDLKELNAQLALKVHMVNKMTQDQEGPYSTVKAHYDATVSDLENQIAALQQEKEELASLLAQVSGNVNACKISEQRRKRLQELEPQITELKKKIQEQANIIKLKQRTEEQLKKFNNDIQAMRAQKVKLVRQMREENEKFRTWRQQKDREVARLKDQDRKRQGQLQKMEVLHAKQQNVLRRKMEDAMAVTKRLKEALSLHSTKPNKSSSTSTTSENDQRIKTWLLGELNLLVKTKEAELALESLKESRRTLATRQSKLEAKLANLDQNDAFLHSLKSEIANVAADIDLRSEQINELNQKIAAADLENKAKTRLDYLQTMIEAKVALKILLEESVAARVENFSLSSELEDLKSELEDLQRQQDEALHEISNCNLENVQMKQKHQSEISKISRDYEERMLTLIRQLPPVGLKESADHKISEKDIMERLRIQQEELERCSTLQEQLHSALNEIESLKQQKPPLLEMRAPLFPSKPKKPKATQRKPSPVPVDVDDVEDIDDYNSDDDPEWRNTPMARRIRKLKEEDEAPPKMFDLEKHAKKIGKRLSRSHCSCSTGGCRSCICSRDSRACTIECGCSASGVCKNVATDNVLKEDQNRIQQHEEQNRMLNETFDLGRKRSQPSSKENSRNGDEVENDLSGTQPLKKSRLGLSKLTKKGGFLIRTLKSLESQVIKKVTKVVVDKEWFRER